MDIPTHGLGDGCADSDADTGVAHAGQCTMTTTSSSGTLTVEMEPSGHGISHASAESAGVRDHHDRGPVHMAEVSTSGTPTTSRGTVASYLGGTLLDSSSALLRHEVAYVLGQMQLPAGASALAECLKRLNEHNMVRHEAAEALGAIVGAEEKCKNLLEEFLKDEDDVVRESCEVALDCQDYWSDLNKLQA